LDDVEDMGGNRGGSKKRITLAVAAPALAQFTQKQLFTKKTKNKNMNLKIDIKLNNS
jgi:hypothetical protein